MKDKNGREITYLRLSVTDLCNLRCTYCMPKHGISKLQHSDILSVEEIEKIVSAAAKCGIRKVRITGGEPLVRKGIIEICERISRIEGIEEVCMTTNGILLPQYAERLKKAGVHRLNISLDTLNAERYNQITRIGTLQNILDGIDAATKAGFQRIKINTVLMGGINDDEIRDLVELTKNDPFEVRFIELMPIGECTDWEKGRFISCETVLKVVPELKEIGSSGDAQLYQIPGYLGNVGLIRPISSHFCPTCNRIRITADGKLKPCLHSAAEIDLRGIKETELVQTIAAAIRSKPQKHHLDEGASQSGRSMNAIGG